MTQRIIAIGGGEIGRPGYPVETLAIDRETIRLSGRKHPKVLFLPTASGDSTSYFEVVKKHFGKRLKCRVSALYLLKEKHSRGELEKKILGAHIIYVGGGNTYRMMRCWRKLGVHKILEQARKKGIVLSGVSAGAICWFASGHSDSRKMKSKKAPYIRVRGLGFISALHCPHYGKEKERVSDIKKMMKKTPGVAIALENCSALEVVGEKCRLITSKRSAKGYKVFWKKGKFFGQRIPGFEWMPLAELVKK